MTDTSGVLHRHEDGREHRHFSAGFEIGGQVRPDADGTEIHQHGTMSLNDGTTGEQSGPVVWCESDVTPEEDAELERELRRDVGTYPYAEHEHDWKVDAGRGARTCECGAVDDPFAGLAP